MQQAENIQDLLAAVTDAMLSEKGDVEAVIGQYAVPRADVDQFIQLINRLHLTLVGVQPSPRFVRRLRQELVGSDGRSVLTRVRHLPVRVQVAAGIALVAGFMIFSRRRLISDAAQEAQEAPAVQS